MRAEREGATPETNRAADAEEERGATNGLLCERQLSAGAVGELLATYGAILRELQRRGVSRTNNAPAGDYAEYLVCRALGGTREPNSAKGADVRVGDTRIQVKARVVTDLGKKSERQLSAIRSFAFDQLAVVLFDPLYRVRKAVLLPQALVQAQSYVSTHVNARTFYATDDLLAAPGADDITLRVRAAGANQAGIERKRARWCQAASRARILDESPGHGQYPGREGDS